MSIELLQRHFDDCQLPVQFLNDDPRLALRFVRLPQPDSVEFYYFADVQRQKRQEMFRLFVHPEAEVHLRDKNPADRHLLLQLRCSLRQHQPASVRNLLLGHDERQLFVVLTQLGEGLAKAIASLKPREVIQAEQRGLKVVRQGDWFFLPTLDFTPPQTAIFVQNETIGGSYAARFGIRVGNPHLAAEQCLIIRPASDGYSFARRPATIQIAVRGKIRHSEHATVELRHWHWAVQNQPRTEVRQNPFDRVVSSIGYLD